MAKSGVVVDAPGETWARIDCAMFEGYRGFQPGWSLARFLKTRRKVRNLAELPRLSIPQILAWADSYHRKKGKWPRQGGHDETLEPPYEKWSAIDRALARGKRGLRGGTTLAGLLWEHRGVYSVTHTPRLTIRQILTWADAHHRRTGRWPAAAPKGVPVFEDARENWSAINACLHMGLRGLPGDDTLAEVLYRYRGVENNYTRPPFTITQILTWAREHQRRTGRWPQAADGPIRGAPGDTWMKVHQALNVGQRGLPGGGDTLARLLNRVYGVPIAGAPPNFKRRQLIAWADTFHTRTGMWPRRESGAIPEKGYLLDSTAP